MRAIGAHVEAYWRGCDRRAPPTSFTKMCTEMAHGAASSRARWCGCMGWQSLTLAPPDPWPGGVFRRSGRYVNSTPLPSRAWDSECWLAPKGLPPRLLQARTCGFSASGASGRILAEPSSGPVRAWILDDTGRNLDGTTTRDVALRDGTIPSRSVWRPSRFCSESALAAFPPTAGCSKRSRRALPRCERAGVPLRPERHTPDSPATIRELILVAALRWLPHCPTCRRGGGPDCPASGKPRRRARAA